MWELSGALAPMAEYRQFIVCRFVPHPTKPGKTNKFPVNPFTGAVWDAHDPAIWLDHATAAAVAAAFGDTPHRHSVGFVFTDNDPFWFLDLDECAVGDGWSEPALHLCRALAGCAVEISQSGRGLHIFGTGVLPPHGNNDKPMRHPGEGSAALYHTRRFVAFGSAATGYAGTDASHALPWLVEHFFPPRADADHPDDWRSEPVPEWHGPVDDDELIARMLMSRQSAQAAFGGRASFADLWQGNAEALGRSFPDSGGRAYDASAADAALASHLAYFTGNHHERIERLMMRSALVRDKWEQRADYLRGTITYCCSRTSRWLNDAPATSGAAVEAAAQGLTFAAAAAGAIPATLSNVLNALRSAESGIGLALDTFRDRIVLKAENSPEWIPFQDVHYVRLRHGLEQRGFKPVGGDLMRDAVLEVATAAAFDSAIEWGNSLQWDGMPRVDTAMQRYFGCADTPYTRAVGRYLFTALAGRLMSPGCQADMAVILVDPKQGTGKTSAVKALAPSEECFGEIDLGKIDDENTSRKLRGKLVIELGELRGLSSKEDEAIKAWVSRTDEEWTPKYREFATTFQRRCILIGTSNRTDLLSDPTGNRRWLPVMSGELDPAGLALEREQLWAEGITLWKQSGIAWREAMLLAEEQHAAFSNADPWEEEVAAWLSSPPPPRPGEVPSPYPRGSQPFSVNDVLVGALRMDVARCTSRDERRMGSVLGRLGYESRPTWLSDGRQARRWVPRIAAKRG